MCIGIAVARPRECQLSSIDHRKLVLLMQDVGGPTYIYLTKGSYTRVIMTVRCLQNQSTMGHIYRVDLKSENGAGNVGRVE
jgi:hypothetical protein